MAACRAGDVLVVTKLDRLARTSTPAPGKQPKLSAPQEAHLVALHTAGGHTISELEELFSITRSTVYRALAGSRARATS